MFCSDCGEGFKSRKSLLALRARCPRCRPRARGARLILIALFAACAISGFLAGRYSVPAERFYIIGTPIDLKSAVSSQTGDDPQATDSTAREQEATCGAPTKTGRPCRRKVRDGGP
ncbi:MAG TPA: hypothetical protein VFQ92_20415, partial [Blastocatellia bacterium]|nr:hypothetical protein [Blastocatellia bacterium]